MKNDKVIHRMSVKEYTKYPERVKDALQWADVVHIVDRYGKVIAKCSHPVYDEEEDDDS